MNVEAALLKVLAEPTRLRLAVLLSRRGPLCVCELAQAIGQADFKVSRHLAVLRHGGLVEAERRGTWMYYRLTKPATRLQQCLHDCLRDCLVEHPMAKEDWQKLQLAQCALPSAHPDRRSVPAAECGTPVAVGGRGRSCKKH